jgi:hypothetical protein
LTKRELRDIIDIKSEKTQGGEDSWPAGQKDVGPKRPQRRRPKRPLQRRNNGKEKESTPPLHFFLDIGRDFC